MSTLPWALSPGFRLDAVSTAALAFEFDIVSVPEENVLLGFADCAVQLAPDPTARPTEAKTVASAAMLRRG